MIISVFGICVQKISTISCIHIDKSYISSTNLFDGVYLFLAAVIPFLFRIGYAPYRVDDYE